MIPFCNNLRKGDPVLDTVSGRRGVVAAEWSPMALESSPAT